MVESGKIEESVSVSKSTSIIIPPGTSKQRSGKKNVKFTYTEEEAQSSSLKKSSKRSRSRKSEEEEES